MGKRRKRRDRGVGELKKSQKIQRMSIFVEKQQNKFSEEPKPFIFPTSVVVQRTLRVLPCLVLSSFLCPCGNIALHTNVHWHLTKLRSIFSGVQQNIIDYDSVLSGYPDNAL